MEPGSDTDDEAEQSTSKEEVLFRDLVYQIIAATGEGGADDEAARRYFLELKLADDVKKEERRMSPRDSRLGTNPKANQLNSSYPTTSYC